MHKSSPVYSPISCLYGRHTDQAGDWSSHSATLVAQKPPLPKIAAAPEQPTIRESDFKNLSATMSTIHLAFLLEITLTFSVSRSFTVGNGVLVDMLCFTGRSAMQQAGRSGDRAIRWAERLLYTSTISLSVVVLVSEVNSDVYRTILRENRPLLTQIYLWRSALSLR